MAALRGKGIFFVPRHIQCRFRGKYHSKKESYWHKTIDRKTFEAVTRPILPEDLVTDPSETCDRVSLKPKHVVSEENKYEQFLVRKFKRLLHQNKMVIACQILSPTRLELRHMWLNLKDHGIDLTDQDNEVVRQAVVGTKWTNLWPLLQGRFDMAYAFSPEPQIAHFVNKAKKMPLLIPLGGFVGDRLLSKDELNRAAKLPTKDLLCGELLSVVESTPSNTTQLLGHHTQALSINLEQFIKDQTDPPSEEKPPSESS